jgi:hypothetical protein
MEALILVLIMLPSWPVLIYKMYKYHRDEFKQHGVGFILYTVSMVLFRIQDMQMYIYITDRFLYLTPHKGPKVHLSYSYICFHILGVHHMFVPFMVIIFKKNKDIFQSFSKIDT